MEYRTRISLPLSAHYFRRIGLLLLLGAGSLLALTLFLFYMVFSTRAVSAAESQAPQSCTPAIWSVSTETDLNNAISCFNGATSGSTTISFTQDISLVAATTTISNTTGSTLNILGNGYALNGGNTHRPLAVTAGAVYIEGLTIVNGYHGDKGGGILFDNQDPAILELLQNQQQGEPIDLSFLPTALISNSQILSNTAEQTGGGIYAFGYNLEIISSDIVDNKAVGTSATGGGIHTNYAELTVTHSELRANSATENGGAFNGDYLMAPTQFINNTITDNEAGRRGGGIYANSPTEFIVSGNTISNNKATTASGAYGGGAIFLAGGEGVTITQNIFIGNQGNDGGALLISSNYNQGVLIDNNEFRHNIAYDTGGAIWLTYAQDVQLTNNHIFSNTASSHGGGIGVSNSYDTSILNNTIELNQSQNDYGGGVYMYRSHDGIFRMNSLSGNTAATRGGGLAFHDGSDLSAEQNLFAGNTAGLYGGGVYFDDAGSVNQPLTFINNTISGNSANANGSAIGINRWSFVEMSYTTIASNTTPITQSAIYIDPSTNSNRLTLNQSIVAYSAGSNCNISLYAATTNIDTDGTCDVADSSIIVDPLLDPLADNGGESLTHALPSASPAVDGGIVIGASVDQRGENRPEGQAPDIGAYELADVEYGFGLSNDTLTIDWSSLGENCEANVYSSSDPFDSYTILTTTSGEDSANLDVSGGQNSYFYFELVNCDGGTDLAPSTSVGTFNFALENSD